MTRTVVALIAFAAGVGVGLFVAKLYATSKIQGAIDSGLKDIGLGGGAVQGLVDQTVVPVLVG